MTRAQNRAIADLIGAGEVTADEIQAENTFQAKQNAKAKLAKKPEPENEADVVDVEAEEVVEPEGFTTADKVEPLDVNPVIVTYAKQVAMRVAKKGLKLTKRSMELKAKGCIKRGEIPKEYEDELLNFIQQNCPGGD